MATFGQPSQTSTFGQPAQGSTFGQPAQNTFGQPTQSTGPSLLSRIGPSAATQPGTSTNSLWPGAQQSSQTNSTPGQLNPTFSFPPQQQQGQQQQQAQQGGLPTFGQPQQGSTATFGQPQQQQQSTNSLFPGLGQSQPQQQSTNPLFPGLGQSTNQQSQQQQQQTSQPFPSLAQYFQNQQNQQQPQQQGYNPTNPSLPGSAQQGTSGQPTANTFGSGFTLSRPPAATFGTFGQTQQPQQQQQGPTGFGSSVLGASALGAPSFGQPGNNPFFSQQQPQQQQIQQIQSQQALIPSRTIGRLFQAPQTVEQRADEIYKAFDWRFPNTCRFKTFFYNYKTPADANVPLAKPDAADQGMWDEALRLNPDPTQLVPVLSVGFNDLKGRVQEQAALANAHVYRLKEIVERTKSLKNIYTLSTSVRLQQAQAVEIHLHHRIIALSARLHLMLPELRAQAITPEEEALSTALHSLDSEISSGGGVGRLRGKVNELWTALGAWKAMRERERREGDGGRGAGGETEWVIADEQGFENIKNVLANQYRALEHLTSVLKNDNVAVDRIREEGYGIRNPAKS